MNINIDSHAYAREATKRLNVINELNFNILRTSSDLKMRNEDHKLTTSQEEVISKVKALRLDRIEKDLPTNTNFDTKDVATILAGTGSIDDRINAFETEAQHQKGVFKPVYFRS